MNKILLVFLSLSTLLFTACNSESKEAQVVEVAETKKETTQIKTSFTLTTTKGETITLDASTQAIFSKQLENKIVLINFWATWCQPCINEMPTLVELQEKYKDNFAIVGVLFEKDYDKTKLQKFMDKFKVNFPVTVGEENFTMAKAFDDVQMIPESFLYSQDGLLIEKFIGEISKEKLEKYIKN